MGRTLTRTRTLTLTLSLTRTRTLTLTLTKEWPGWSDATQRYATAQGLAAERADWDRKKQLGQTSAPRSGW